MPELTVLAVRLSLLYLLIGFALGAAILVNEAYPISARLWSFTKLHLDCLLLGFMVQLALGVAFWILPRFMKGAPRGKESIAWAALALLNAGIVLAGLASVIAIPWLEICGRVLEMAGGLLFLVHAWRRLYASEVICRP